MHRNAGILRRMTATQVLSPNIRVLSNVWAARGRQTAVKVLIAALWCYATLPSLAAQLQGRGLIDVTQSRAVTGLAFYIQAVCIVWILLSCGHIILAGFSRPVKRARAGYLAMLLAPWVAAQIATAFSASPLGISILYFPAVVIALWIANPPLEVLSVVGMLTVATAAASVVLMFLVPALVTIPQSAGEYAKAFFGDKLLAGPFGHPNTFGVAMALGFPAISFFRNKRWRLLGYCVTFIALLLAASRTSLLGVILAMSIACLFVLGRRRVGQRLFLLGVAFFGTLATLIAIIVVPLTTTDPMGWSNRGRIWMTSLDYFRASPIIGNGPDFYGQIALIATDFNRLAFHGHNLFVNSATTTGWVGLLGIGVVLGVLFISSARALAGGKCYPLMFVAAFAGVSLLEVVTDFRNFGSFAYCAWVPFAIIIFSFGSRRGAPTRP